MMGAALVGTWGDVNTMSVFLQSSYLFLQFTLHRVKQQQLLTLEGRNKTTRHAGSEKVDALNIEEDQSNPDISPPFDLSPPSAGRQPGSHTRTCSSPTPSTAPCRSLGQTSVWMSQWPTLHYCHPSDYEAESFVSVCEFQRIFSKEAAKLSVQLSF